MNIFCIGENKTGTRSLHKAFNILGLRSLHDVVTIEKSMQRWKNGEIAPLLSDLIDKHDCFLDGSHKYHFEQLKISYPEAKFILTTRNIDDWVASRIVHILHNHFTHKTTWGVNSINVPAWKREYERHHMSVREFFQGDPNYMEIDIDKGELRWEPLCEFLKIEVPNVSFPIVNTGKERLRELADLY